MTILHNTRGAPASAEIRNNGLMSVAGTQQREELQSVLAKIDTALADSFARQTVVFHSDAACQYIADTIENKDSSIEIRIVQTDTGAIHLYEIPIGEGLLLANNLDIVYAILSRDGGPTGSIASHQLTVANGNLIVGAAALPPLERDNIFYIPIVQRIDGAFGKRYVHWFFGHGVWAEGSQAQVGLAGTADDPINTASLLSMRAENRWLQSKYEFYTDNIFKRYTDTRIDKDNFPYTAVLDDPQEHVQFSVAGQEFTSTNLVDSEFLKGGSDLYDAEVLLFYKPDSVDASPIVEVSRDGFHFTQMETKRLGETDLIYGTIYFPDEPTDTLSEGLSDLTGGQPLNNTDAMFLSQKLEVEDAARYFRSIKLNLEKQGAPTGSIRLSIHKGNPTAASSEVWATSQWMTCDDITTAGDYDFKLNTMIPIGIYYIVIEGNFAYYDSYTGGDRIIVGTGSPNTTKVMQKSNDLTTWIDVSSTNLFFEAVGRLIDLRVKVESSGANKLLAGVCIEYGSRKTIANGFINLNTFTFTTNDNEFSLDFIPDHRSLTGYVRGTGQVFRYGDFDIIGKKVIFPVNFFADAGPVNTIEFVHQYGYSIDESDSNLARLRENGLGSEEPVLDLSAAGKGIKLRADNGVLVHAFLHWNGTEYEWNFTPL